MKLTGAFITLFVFFLCGCGGGVGGHGGYVTTKTISGIGGDGFIRRALVGVDTNLNNILETGEVRTFTDDDGYYAFRVREDSNSPIILSGGIDSILEIPFTGNFQAAMPSQTTTQMITPLTTLLAFGANEFTVRTLLNLAPGIDWNRVNPIDNFPLFRAGVQVQTMSSQISTVAQKPQFLVFQELARLNTLSLQSIDSLVSSMAQTSISPDMSTLIYESFRAIGNAQTRTAVIALETLAMDSFLK
ncbi:hypothetical protein HOF92_00175 [bacterium]|nr:hypothetical protein [bacterium]